MGAIMPRLVPQVYISYKGKILSLLLFYFFSILCVNFSLVLFIGKVFMHIKLK